jgi:excinuclease ABC subunit C
VADPASYRPAPGSIPESPGVYRFRDERGRVIYVGKAKSLRSRLNSYFADFVGLHPRTQSMLRSAASVDWTVVATEVEALQLEYNWIKEFDPRFNVRYRDDKSYPYLAVTMDEEYPRVMVMRGAKRRGVRYFGPYSHAWAIRDTVDTLLRVFPVRTCSAGVFKRAGQIGRPCLLGYIGKCSAPCVGRIDAEEHRCLAEEFCDFMAGQTAKFTRRLESEMRRAADAEEYERAARLRDDIQALQRALEKQAVVLGDGTDCDVIALAEDQLEAAVQVFYVRGGRVRGQRGWVVDKVEEITAGELVEQFLGQVYGEDPVAGEAAADTADGDADDGAASGGDNGRPGRAARRGGRRATGRNQPRRDLPVPREVLVPVLPPAAGAVEEWLAARRGGRVSLRVPQRGDKKALLETVARNAAESLALHKTRRASDLTTRSLALHEIQEALGLDEAPLRIECYDVSNLQGTHVVASMIVFEDGLARKSEYRRFSIRGLDGTDDVASIHEVISRRFRRYLEEREATGELDVLGDPAGWGQGEGGGVGARTSGPRKFAYPPNLLVVDGGPAQVAAAARALDELGIDDVSVCGLAKRLEEVWLPGEDGPVIMPRTSEGLYLLQRVRDEAHRFAITYHRKKRSAALTTSELDAVPGLGPARKATLLRHFGSVRRIAGASVAQIADLPGFGPRIAETVAAALQANRREAAPPGLRSEARAAREGGSEEGRGGGWGPGGERETLRPAETGDDGAKGPGTARSGRHGAEAARSANIEGGGAR